MRVGVERVLGVWEQWQGVWARGRWAGGCRSGGAGPAYALLQPPNSTPTLPPRLQHPHTPRTLDSAPSASLVSSSALVSSALSCSATTLSCTLSRAAASSPEGVRRVARAAVAGGRARRWAAVRKPWEHGCAASALLAGAALGWAAWDRRLARGGPHQNEVKARVRHGSIGAAFAVAPLRRMARMRHHGAARGARAAAAPHFCPAPAQAAVVRASRQVRLSMGRLMVGGRRAGCRKLLCKLTPSRPGPAPR